MEDVGVAKDLVDAALFDDGGAVCVGSSSIRTGQWLVSKNRDKSLGLRTCRNEGGEKEGEEEGEEGRGAGVKV